MLAQTKMGKDHRDHGDNVLSKVLWRVEFCFLSRYDLPNVCCSIVVVVVYSIVSEYTDESNSEILFRGRLARKIGSGNVRRISTTIKGRSEFARVRRV